jgi:hypothetical protein
MFELEAKTQAAAEEWTKKIAKAGENYRKNLNRNDGLNSMQIPPSRGGIIGRAATNHASLERSEQGNRLCGHSLRYAVYDYLDGRKYVGWWLEAQPHGTGLMSTVDGRQYKGEWRDGQPEGFGVFTWGGFESNGQSYRGQVLDGKWHGSGVLNYGSNETRIRHYAGDFEKSLRHGHGVAVYLNGDVFHGTPALNRRTHARTHARTQARTQTHTLLLPLLKSPCV